MLGVSAFFLVLSLVLFFRRGSGLMRWLLVATWASITFTYWQLRRALPPGTS